MATRTLATGPATRRLTATGFTLIELMIVVAILAILSTAAVPNMKAAIYKARYARMLQDIQTIQNAGAIAFARTGGTWPIDVQPGLMPPEMRSYLAKWPQPPCPVWQYDWEGWQPLGIVAVTVRDPSTNRVVMWKRIEGTPSPPETYVEDIPQGMITCRE